MTTIHVLFDACWKNDIGKLTSDALSDWFGDCKDSANDVRVVFGVYRGMITMRGVSKKTLMNVFYSNKIDDFIHQYSSVVGTYGYCEQFVSGNLRIGETNHSTLITELPVYDEDKCPSCQAPGYMEYRRSGHDTPDCVCGCGTFVCPACSVAYGPCSRKSRCCFR